MFLDTKLYFHKHLKDIISKTNITICQLWKLQHILPGLPLVKFQVTRPYLDYQDITCDQTYNALCHQKLQSGQCNLAVAPKVTIRWTSKEKLYNELDLETCEKSLRYR